MFCICLHKKTMYRLTGVMWTAGLIFRDIFFWYFPYKRTVHSLNFISSIFVGFQNWLETNSSLVWRSQNIYFHLWNYCSNKFNNKQFRFKLATCFWFHQWTFFKSHLVSIKIILHWRPCLHHHFFDDGDKLT